MTTDSLVLTSSQFHATSNTILCFSQMSFSMLRHMFVCFSTFYSLYLGTYCVFFKILTLVLLYYFCKTLHSI